MKDFVFLTLLIFIPLVIIITLALCKAASKDTKRYKG